MEKLIEDRVKSKSAFSLFVIYVVIVCAVYVLPSLKFQVPYIIAGSLMLVSLPPLLGYEPQWSTYGFFLLLETTIIFCSNIFVNQLGITAAINEAIRNIRFFLPVFWGCYAVKYCSPKQKSVVLCAFLIITSFVTFKTLEALQENAWIARLLAQEQSTSSLEINAYRLGNVGGYTFSYMMGIVTLVSFWSFLKSKSFWCKIFSFVMVVICYYYVIQTMYATLLLLTTVGILTIAFFSIKRSWGKCLFLILAILLIFSLAPIFDYLSGLFSNESLLSVKFAQMHDSLTGGGADSLGSRPQLLSQALENWFKTPFFGGAYTTPSHSLLFELLQQNGLFGFGVWLSFFIMSWKRLTKTLKENGIDTLLFNIVMFYFAELSIFNDTRYSFEITITAFFIVPLFCSVFCKKSCEGAKKDDE